MIAWTLALAVAVQSDLSVQAHVRRSEGRYELSIAGKSKDLPEGTVVTLRFRRRADRADWATGEISERTLEPSWDRRASVERGGFHHRELLASPGDVEIEFAFGEAAPILSRVFRTASVPEVVQALRIDAKKIEAAIAERRGAGPSSGILPATADLLDRYRSDLERLAGASSRKGGAAALSAITGEPVSLEEAGKAMGWIEEIARRERHLVLVREARSVVQDILSLAAAGEPRKWTRALPSLEKSLQALEEAARPEKSDGLNLLVATAEMLFNLAPTVVECPASAGADWEKLAHDAVQTGALLEERLRRPM